MRKVYRNFIRSVVAAGCICLFTGCGIVKLYSGAKTRVKYIMKLAGNGSDILDKDDIFASWGINDSGIEKAEEAFLKEPDKIFRSENEYSHHFYHLYSADELAKVSKEQKLEIFDRDSELVCTMKDLEEIADFYNQIKRETWL